MEVGLEPAKVGGAPMGGGVVALVRMVASKSVSGDRGDSALLSAVWPTRPAGGDMPLSGVN